MAWVWLSQGSKSLDLKLFNLTHPGGKLGSSVIECSSLQLHSPIPQFPYFKSGFVPAVAQTLPFPV